MTHRDDAPLSRTIGVARELSATHLTREKLLKRKIVLTGQLDTLRGPNGMSLFLDSLALLRRLGGSLDVVLPLGLENLESLVEKTVESEWSAAPVQVHWGAATDIIAAAHAVLNIGLNRPMDERWTTIASDGWIAMVTSRGSTLAQTPSEENPIAAMMAASLGAAEIFKRIYSVPHELAPPMDTTQFSVFNLKNDTTDSGPALPTRIAFPDTLVVGAGAIGNGIILLLAQLQAEGRFHVVDKQNFGPENLGTCVLLTPNAVGEPKSKILAEILGRSGFASTTWEKAPVSEARSSLGDRSLAIDLVLTGLDDVSARHDSQSIWPRILIDGGINAIGAAVSTYRFENENRACMKCIFDLPTRDERKLQSDATGLSVDALRGDLGRTITDEDLAAANPAKRAWLAEKQREGRTLCATISEAQADNVLGIELEEGFRPSAAFVATAAASLVLAQAVKSLYFSNLEYAHLFQIGSLMLGPASSETSFRAPNQRCSCVTERDALSMVMAQRRSKAMQFGTKSR